MTRDDQLPIDGLPGPTTGASTDILVFRNGIGQPIAVPLDVVTSAERAFRCYNRRLAGESWMTIAASEGYPTATSAAADVRRYTAEGAALVSESSKQEMLQLELSRLDALLGITWPMAMAGSLAAIDMARKIVVDQAKVAGLDPEKIAQESNTIGRTVVVHQEEGGYVRSLRAAAGE